MLFHCKECFILTQESNFNTKTGKCLKCVKEDLEAKRIASKIISDMWSF